MRTNNVDAPEPVRLFQTDRKTMNHLLYNTVQNSIFNTLLAFTEHTHSGS